MSDANDDPKQANIVSAPAPTCPLCFRDLEMRVEMQHAGKIHVALACARHGSFPNGWQPRLTSHGRALQWATRQQDLKRARSQGR
jgi:hypothetical protein